MSCPCQSGDQPAASSAPASKLSASARLWGCSRATPAHDGPRRARRPFRRRQTQRTLTGTCTFIDFSIVVSIALSGCKIHADYRLFDTLLTRLGGAKRLASQFVARILLCESDWSIMGFGGLVANRQAGGRC